MEPIRLGCVKYLNTLAMIEGLQACRDVELVAAVPSKLIGMLERDEVEVALASVIDAARSAEEMVLLPVGMIGCDGPTLTVRVFSSVPLEKLHGVHADTDSHTSTALMQVIMWRRYGRRIEIVDFDARERVALRSDGATPPQRRSDEGEWPEAMLLIGDKVVTDAPPAERYPHQLDLGEAWKELTGLPFVYAVWMCQASRAGEVGVRLAAELLDRQRRHNMMRLDWIVGTRAPERHWPEDLAREYLGSRLKYDVGEPERQAVDRFLGECTELGLAPRRSVCWAAEGSMSAR